MKAVFIYPNQLFENHPSLSRSRKVLLVQDPLFFADKQYPVGFHKKKILLHFLSMDDYKDNLVDRGYDVEVISFNRLQTKNHTQKIIKEYELSEIHIADVVDYTLEKRIKDAASKLNVRLYWYNSPMFLLNKDEVENDFRKKNFHFMSNFYKKQRRRYNLLMDDEGKPEGGKWSFDLENRKKLPKGIQIPAITKFEYNNNKTLRGNRFINKYFKNNIGTSKAFNYPVNHKQSRFAFNQFLEHKFQLFGPYEDAISKHNHSLFHSILTPYLNIGLITPKEIIQKVMDFSGLNSIPLNSIEGFIRQIIGWREFIRGVYTVDGVKQRTRNYWGFTKAIPKTFYDGTTGLEPLDNSISRCLKHGYAHHIERLMILGNIMILSRFDPDSVYQWFMEFFIDAYDWVMVPNIYGMSQFADGGLMSTKPYISGSNYILKMSDYKKGRWSGVWDALYWEFINSNREFFLKNHRMAMMVSMYDKKPKDIRSEYSFIYKDYQLMIN